mgnify:CR=1 FL=1
MGINDEALVPGEDRFLQIVSCNTHNIAALVKTLSENEDHRSGLEQGGVVRVRRARRLNPLVAVDLVIADDAPHALAEHLGAATRQRALEKLRKFFTKRGVTLSAAALAIAVVFALAWSVLLAGGALKSRDRLPA